MSNSMHASAARAVFGLPLPVLMCFVANLRTSVDLRLLSILQRLSSSFFKVNLAIIVRNVTLRNKQRCAIAEFEHKVWRLPISYS